MTINFTNSEIIKLANVLKTFGVPDVDVEEITKNINRWNENGDVYAYDWGTCLKNTNGVTLTVDDAYTCRALEATTVMAPAVNKLMGVFAALKPLCEELINLAKKADTKLTDIFKEPVQHSLYWFSHDCNTYLLVVSYNNHATDCGEYMLVQGPERYHERRMNMREAVRFVQDYNNAIDPIASDAGTTKYNVLSREEREDMCHLLDKAMNQFDPEEFKRFINNHNWMTFKDAIHSEEARRVLAKIKEEEKNNTAK